MRSISFAIPFALFSALLVGCPDGDKVESAEPDDTNIIDTDCIDADEDGYDSCEDCDDTSASINPGVSEDCDGVDNDCDGDIDEDVTSDYYADLDGDGFGDPETTTAACEPTDGWVPTSDDCDDEDPFVYPGAEEICDGVDNDCNDIIDDGLDSSTYYADSDGDSYGNPDESIEACDMPEGYTDNDDDCDDLDVGEPVHADSVSGTSSGTGSLTNPLDTIQACIDLADVCCYAMPGTYNEDIDFTGKNILVLGVDGVDSTFIVGTGETSVVTIANGETDEAILTGFTISGGTGTVAITTESVEVDSYTTTTTTTYRYYGGGIYVNGASPSLYDLIVTDNELPAYSYTPNADETELVYVYSYGGGMFAGESTMEPWNIWFNDNYADDGGGVYANSSTSIDGKWLGFDGNGAS